MTKVERDKDLRIIEEYCMNEEKKSNFFRDVIVVGFALFSMFFGAAAAFVSLNSSIEFQAPQDGHFPYHLGLS